MRTPVAGINPEVLRWARDRAGYSIAEIATEFSKAPEIIEQWESGKSAPTYGQLERLADRFYKRSVALFFLPEPPEEADPSQSFRTLPVLEIQGLLPDTRFAVREATARQIDLYELAEGRNPSPNRIFEDLRATPRSNPAAQADQTRAYLGVDLPEQTSWSNADEALKRWRATVQDNGVFVFKRSFKQKDVSGFCLYDDTFPLIYVNNSTAKTRQIFTLFHELAHLLLGTSGVAKVNDRFIKDLTGDSQRTEIFCNRFAGELLVPSADFEKRIPSTTDDEVSASADHYNVSREVILRKLFDRGLVSQQEYEDKVMRWSREYGAGTQSSGGNYYYTQVAYLGGKYLDLAFSRFYQGKLSRVELAGYLKVKVRNLDVLEQHAVG